jgi:hypothetical protein
MTPQKQPRPEPADRSAPSPKTDALLREIAEDALHEPERFLQESRVPAGGE